MTLAELQERYKASAGTGLDEGQWTVDTHALQAAVRGMAKAETFPVSYQQALLALLGMESQTRKNAPNLRGEWLDALMVEVFPESGPGVVNTLRAMGVISDLPMLHTPAGEEGRELLWGLVED